MPLCIVRRRSQGTSRSRLGERWPHACSVAWMRPSGGRGSWRSDRVRSERLACASPHDRFSTMGMQLHRRGPVARFRDGASASDPPPRSRAWSQSRARGGHGAADGSCRGLGPYRVRERSTRSRGRCCSRATGVGSTIAGPGLQPAEGHRPAMDGFDFYGTRTKTRTCSPGHGTGAGRVVGVGLNSPCGGTGRRGCGRRS
jgi:hypothetical protein